MVEIRNLTPLKAQACVEALNALRLDLLNLRKGTVYHASATDLIDDDIVVDGYDGYDAPFVRINNYVTVYHAHLASVTDEVTGLGAHLSEDTTNVVSASVATNNATAITRANELKADFNAHILSTVFHPVADSVNTVTASDATNEATLLTLLADLFTKLNGHFGAALSFNAIELIAP